MPPTADIYALMSARLAKESVRGQAIFTNEIKLIWPVQSFAQKYLSYVFQKIMIISPHPMPA